MEITESDLGQRVDIVLTSKMPQVSRSTIKKVIKGGLVHVNGESVMPNYKLREGDSVEIDKEQISTFINTNEKANRIKATKMDIDVMFEDEHTLIVNKPAGIHVHPVKKSDSASLLNGLYYYYKSRGETIPKLRLVHRLDTGTSGVLLVSKTLRAHEHYSSQFEERTVEKQYLAVVTGNFQHDQITISDPLSTEKNKEGRYFTTDNTDISRHAKTEVSKLGVKKFNERNASVLLVKPRTGRTHQIRVHLSAIGYPIIGDEKYAGAEYDRMLLHAYSLNLVLYGDKKPTRFESAKPPEFSV